MKSFKPQCYIFDLDGTIADCSRRRELALENEKQGRSFWEVFLNPASIPLDRPNTEVIKYFNYLVHESKRKVFILSGRNESLRDATMVWFARNNIFGYEDLVMRADDDRRDDTAVKQEMLEKKILPTYDPVLFIDDRDKVVKHWRSKGFQCWQVAEGAF